MSIFSKLFLLLRGKKKVGRDIGTSLLLQRRIIHPGFSVRGEPEAHSQPLSPSGDFSGRICPEEMRERDADLFEIRRRRLEREKFERIRKYFDEHEGGG